MDGIDPPAATPPAVLDDASAFAVAATRPVRIAGAQPIAAVVLLDVEAQGLS